MTHTAVIAGVGPGLGESLARKFVEEGANVGLFARSGDYLANLAAELGERALAVPVDISDREAVAEAFDAVRGAYGPVDLLVNHASAANWAQIEATTADEFDETLAVGTSGAFYCTKEAVPDMKERGEGTIIFTGATTSVRGNEGAIAFSATKFANRGMAESLARHLGPEGIHVAHVVIDGQIHTPSAKERWPDRDPETFLDPDAIAESYWDLVEQDRSAWTLELDLRPHVEEF